MASNKKRVLMVSGKPNWAYDAIAKSLMKYNDREDLELDIFYSKGHESDLPARVNGFDRVFFMGWQDLGKKRWVRVENLFPFIATETMLTGIHSHHSWDNRKTLPDYSVKPPTKLIRFLNQFRAANVVSRRLYEIFLSAGVNHLSYTPNGVDTELFKPLKPIQTGSLAKVGYSGTLHHDWRKGMSAYIRPSVENAGLEFSKACYNSDSYVPLEQMPEFYNDVDIYVCASSSEGFSLSVLEASACGRPVISTRVGGCEDLIIDGVNGFLVDRDVEAITEKLKLFKNNPELQRKMGAENRRIVEERWSWKERSKDWLDFMYKN